MIQFLLDTSICVFFLRGKHQIDQIIRDKGTRNCFISELTVFELKFGAENSDKPEKSHLAVNNFIKGLTIIPIFGVVEKYAEMKVYLRRRGTPMHDEFDLIIGLTAILNDLTLVTDNIKDFRFIPDLKIENWVERNV